MASTIINSERGGLPSASGASKWYTCAGSPSLEASAPEGEPTDEAIQGSEIAKAREEDSDDGLDEEGKTISERLKAQEQKAVEDWMAERFPSEQARPVPIREMRCWIRDEKLDPVASAKPDWFYIFNDEALCGDDKSGYLNVTDAHKNLQARVQAVALKHEFPHLKRIRVAISQFRFRGRFSASDYDEKGLVIAEKEVFFRLWLTKDPYASRVPGDHCKYCRGKTRCPENAAMTMLPIVAFGSSVPTKKADVSSAVAQLDLPTLGFIRHKSSLIENILEAVGKRLKTYSPEELATVGLRLVPSDGVRTLPDVQALWGVLHQQGVTEVELRSILKASIGSAQELLVKKLQEADPALTAKAAKEQADKILEPAVKMAARDPQLRSL